MKRVGAETKMMMGGHYVDKASDGKPIAIVEKWTPYRDIEHWKKVAKKSKPRKGEIGFRYALDFTDLHNSVRFCILEESDGNGRISNVWRFHGKNKKNHPLDPMFFIETESNWKITVHMRRVHMRFKGAVPDSPLYGSPMIYDISEPSEEPSPFLRILFPTFAQNEKAIEIDNDRRGMYFFPPEGGKSLCLSCCLIKGNIDVQELPELENNFAYAAASDSAGRTLAIYLSSGEIGSDVIDEVRRQLLPQSDPSQEIAALFPIRSSSESALMVDIGSVRNFFRETNKKSR